MATNDSIAINDPHRTFVLQKYLPRWESEARSFVTVLATHTTHHIPSCFLFLFSTLFCTYTCTRIPDFLG